MKAKQKVDGINIILYYIPKNKFNLKNTFLIRKNNMLLIFKLFIILIKKLYIYLSVFQILYKYFRAI